MVSWNGTRQRRSRFSFLRPRQRSLAADDEESEEHRRYLKKKAKKRLLQYEQCLEHRLMKRKRQRKIIYKCASKSNPCLKVIPEQRIFKKFAHPSKSADTINEDVFEERIVQFRVVADTGSPLNRKVKKNVAALGKEQRKTMENAFRKFDAKTERLQAKMKKKQQRDESTDRYDSNEKNVVAFGKEQRKTKKGDFRKLDSKMDFIQSKTKKEQLRDRSPDRYESDEKNVAISSKQQRKMKESTIRRHDAKTDRLQTNRKYLDHRSPDDSSLSEASDILRPGEGKPKAKDAKDHCKSTKDGTPQRKLDLKEKGKSAAKEMTEDHSQTRIRPTTKQSKGKDTDAKDHHLKSVKDRTSKRVLETQKRKGSFGRAESSYHLISTSDLDREKDDFSSEPSFQSKDEDKKSFFSCGNTTLLVLIAVVYMIAILLVVERSLGVLRCLPGTVDKTQHSTHGNQLTPALSTSTKSTTNPLTNHPLFTTTSVSVTTTTNKPATTTTATTTTTTPRPIDLKPMFLMRHNVHYGLPTSLPPIPTYDRRGAAYKEHVTYWSNLYKKFFSENMGLFHISKVQIALINYRTDHWLKEVYSHIYGDYHRNAAMMKWVGIEQGYTYSSYRSAQCTTNLISHHFNLTHPTLIGFVSQFLVEGDFYDVIQSSTDQGSRDPSLPRYFDQCVGGKRWQLYDPLVCFGYKQWKCPDTGQLDYTFKDPAVTVTLGQIAWDDPE